jgi:hypothetical protein
MMPGEAFNAFQEQFRRRCDGRTSALRCGDKDTTPMKRARLQGERILYGEEFQHRFPSLAPA